MEVTDTERQAVDRAAQTLVGGTFVASLEMKENVEFVLTPALLMREIMSPEVVVTYPSE